MPDPSFPSLTFPHPVLGISRDGQIGTLGRRTPEEAAQAAKAARAWATLTHYANGDSDFGRALEELKALEIDRPEEMLLLVPKVPFTAH